MKRKKSNMMFNVNIMALFALIYYVVVEMINGTPNKDNILFLIVLVLANVLFIESYKKNKDIVGIINTFIYAVVVLFIYFVLNNSDLAILIMPMILFSFIAYLELHKINIGKVPRTKEYKKEQRMLNILGMFYVLFLIVGILTELVVV